MYWLADSLIGTQSSAFQYRQRSKAGLGLAKLFQGLRKWHRRQLAIRQLHALDDRILKDIGVSRAEIDSLVNDLVSGDQSRRRSVKPSRQPLHATAARRKGAADVHRIEVAGGKKNWKRAA